MQLVSMFADRNEDEDVLVAGVLRGEWAVDLSVAGALAGEDWGMADLHLGEMLDYGLIDLDLFDEIAVDAVSAAARGKKHQGFAIAYPAGGIELGPPIPVPTSLRDFTAFEQHVKGARSRRGLEMAPEWYEMPAFFFGNHNAVIGPGALVPRPKASRELDFELEIACVVGYEGIDIAVDEAYDHVLGFTIMNDWSARDIQRREMKLGMGPHKGKDFATSIGPAIVTLDELADKGLADGRYDLQMLARVNGRQVSDGNFKDIYWTFAQLIERASADTWLLPGDVIGSGAVSSGCILELGAENVPWLEPSDTVELEIERLGVLRNTIAAPGDWEL